jgi:hypothetical protein
MVMRTEISRESDACAWSDGDEDGNDERGLGRFATMSA